MKDKIQTGLLKISERYSELNVNNIKVNTLKINEQPIKL